MARQKVAPGLPPGRTSSLADALRPVSKGSLRAANRTPPAPKGTNAMLRPCHLRIARREWNKMKKNLNILDNGNDIRYHNNVANEIQYQWREQYDIERWEDRREASNRGVGGFAAEGTAFDDGAAAGDGRYGFACGTVRGSYGDIGPVVQSRVTAGGCGEYRGHDDTLRGSEQERWRLYQLL